MLGVSPAMILGSNGINVPIHPFTPTKAILVIKLSPNRAKHFSNEKENISSNDLGFIVQDIH